MEERRAVPIISQEEKVIIFERLRQVDVDKTRVDTLECLTNTLICDVKEIKEKLLSRPTWVVTIVITGLGSLCGILLTSLILLIIRK